MVILQQRSEITVASSATEHPTESSRLLEMILERGNMHKALKRVCRNKGAPGVDGMKVTQLPGYLKRHWLKIKELLLTGDYSPLPVRGKLIPKPSGGERLLGIPTVLDRLIQQAIAQIVQQIWDPTFSEFSYGFRPGRSPHDAVLRAKQYLLLGFKHCVDMDLSKFFDRVNHDRLMSRLATKIKDKRLLKLIRSYLEAGVLLGGLVSDPGEGSRKAAERVMKSISCFITGRLKLKVNEEKSQVTRPWLCQFLGFTFIDMYGQTKIRIHSETIESFKERIREITNRNCGRSIKQVIFKLNPYLKGWWNYYRLCEARSLFKALNSWIVRRLRCLLWKQWKNPRTRVRNRLKRGISHKYAMTCGNSRKKYWRMSRVKWVVIALPTSYFLSLGLFQPGN